MAAAAPLARRTRHGYVAVPNAPLRDCGSPFVAGRLRVTSQWALHCFAPAWHRARTMWGGNAQAISTEIVGELVPPMRIVPTTGPEQELRRRVDLAVAVLLNRGGVPTGYPPQPRTPRPEAMPAGPPWYRALLTGWIR